MARSAKPKMPKYLKGRRVVRAHGIEFAIEDELDVELRPDPEKIAAATSEADVVKEIYLAFEKMRPVLLRKKIPKFNMEQFVNDFSSFLIQRT